MNELAYNIFTTFNNVKNRFEANNVPFTMTNIEQITKVFGIKMDCIEGYSDLSEHEKTIVNKAVLQTVNSCGLDSKAEYLPRTIKLYKNYIRITTLKGVYFDINFKGDILN